MKTTHSHCGVGPGPNFKILHWILPVMVFQLPKAPRRDKGSCLNSNDKCRSPVPPQRWPKLEGPFHFPQMPFPDLGPNVALLSQASLQISPKFQNNPQANQRIHSRKTLNRNTQESGRKIGGLRGQNSQRTARPCRQE